MLTWTDLGSGAWSAKHSTGAYTVVQLAPRLFAVSHGPVIGQAKTLQAGKDLAEKHAQRPEL